MRIISGTAGGIAIKVPGEVARPTTDRVREALFSMLGGSLEGARVLDLFAGSGALGLESLSRGAGEAVFVEQHTGSCAVIRDNLERSRLKGGRLVKGEAFATLRRMDEAGERFDVVFADPPYPKQPGAPDLGWQLMADPHLRAVLKPDGLLVLETMVTKRDSRVIADWDVIRDRAYGSTRILILQSPATFHAQSPGAAALQPPPALRAPGDGSGSMEEDEGPRREGG